MFCRYCGNEISNDAVFCNKCGKKLSVQEQKEKTNPVNSSPVSKPVSEKGQKPLVNKHRFTKLLVIAAIVFVSLMLPFRISGMFMKKHHTLLMTAVEKNNIFLVRTLLLLGADVNAMDSEGDHTALSIAAREGNCDVARILIKNGAQINQNGGNPLHYAVMKGRPEMVSLLIKAGADVNAYTKGNPGYDFTFTPLSEVTTTETWADRPADMEKCMRLLIENRADIELQGKLTGVSILHLLADSWMDKPGLDYQKGGKVKALAILISYGANMNIRDNDGQTPLMKAALADCYSTAKVLLDNGADIWAKDNNGRTALAIAKADPRGNGTFRVANLITEYMNKR